MKILHSWQTLDWVFIEESVYRLQIKIYQAALVNNLDKTHKLQNRLVRSSLSKYLAVKILTETNTAKLNSSISQKVNLTPSEKFFLARMLRISCLKNSNFLINFSKGISLIDKAKEILVYLVLSPQWEAYYYQAKIRQVKSSFEVIQLLKSYISCRPTWAIQVDVTNLVMVSPKKLVRKAKTFSVIKYFLKNFLKLSPSQLFKEITFLKVLLLKIGLYKFPELLEKWLLKQRFYNKSYTNFLYLFSYKQILILHPNRDNLYLIKSKLDSVWNSFGFIISPYDINIVTTLTSLKKKGPNLVFLGLDLSQTLKMTSFDNRLTKTIVYKTIFRTSIRVSKEEKKIHKLQIRQLIRKNRAIQPWELIKKLNKFIKNWTEDKKKYVSPLISLELERFLSLHLWKWAKKRHPNLNTKAIKLKYWKQIKSGRWVFTAKNSRLRNSKIQITSYCSVMSRLGSLYRRKSTISPRIMDVLLPNIFYDTREL